MRRQAIGICALAGSLCLCLVGRGAADGDGALPSSFFAMGSEVSWRIAEAPLASVQLGKAAAAIADGATLPRVLGDEASALPTSWLLDGIGASAKSGRMPLAARFRTGPCKCATQIGDDSTGRVAALYVEKTFDLAADQAVELLEVRALYNDGIIIAINGREVVRQNLGSDGVLETALRPRGPEPESFTIPVTPGLLVSGQNVIRIEVRPSGHRDSPTLDFELAARRGPRIVRGPIVARDLNELTVTFDTDLAVKASVEWGLTSALGNTVQTAGGALAVRHTATIAVAGESSVHYRVVAGPDASQTYAVAARPAKGEPIRFGVYGDMRGGHATHGKIVDALIAEAPDFVIVTGDLVLRGSDEGDWQRFFSVASELLATTPYFPVAGNHDMGTSGIERRRVMEHFPVPPAPEGRPHWASWYGFDVGEVHFVVLDSNSYEAAEQLEWLEADLADAKARGVRAIFASTHDGPYSRGIHRGNRYAAKTYAPLLAKNDVVMLFSGHDHLYQRGEVDGLRYIVSGGGGAPLYPIRCGVPGRRKCAVDDGMVKVASEHHYVLVQVFDTYARVCPKRPDRTAVESCIKLKF